VAMKWVSEFIFGVEDENHPECGNITQEDSGCAEIVGHIFPESHRMHFRIISWDESDGSPHYEFREMTGKRVRVTLEIVDT